MNEICTPEKCTGCGACFATCPFNAIEICKDDFGTLYPKIQELKCKKCNKCFSVCPAINPVSFCSPIKCYAAYTKNDLDKSTVASGGVATTLGKYVTRNSGIVFGTVFDTKPHFSVATTEEEVNSFKGSKYVYIFPDKVFQEVKASLVAGKLCLFIGTPCQIGGLKSFLKNDYPNLIMVDLICHGVPSLTYLNEWLNHILKRGYHSVSFRGKRNYFLSCFDDKNKLIYSKKQDEDAYFYAFLRGLIHRENCYDCQYAKAERCSDITIGDFWGLDKTALNGYSGKKSVIITNTEKGNRFFEQTKNLFIYEERRLDEAVRGNKQLSMPSPVHPKRNLFMEIYKENGFCTAVRKTGILNKTLKNRYKNLILHIPRKIKHCILK